MTRTFVLSLGAAGLFTTAVAAFGQDVKTDKGMQVFVGQKCTTCHSIAGKGNKKGSLDDVGSKLSGEEIRQWITDPAGTAAKTKPAPTRKPPMKKKDLSAGDVDALVTLLSSLKAK